MIRIKIITLVTCLFALHLSAFSQAEKLYVLSSPGKNTVCEIGVNKTRSLTYRIKLNGNAITTWSPLGLVVNSNELGENTLIVKATRKSVSEKFAWSLGEDDVITNNYNQLVLSCKSRGEAFNLIARVLDGSVAFRYEIPNVGNTNAVITKEKTAFNLTRPFILYQYNQESVFTPTVIDTFTRSSDLPTTLTSDGLYATVGEAENLNYTKAELKKGAEPNSLAVAFLKDSVVSFKGGFQTPWRTLSVSTTAIGLHKFSQLYLKLATAPANNTVPAWIKPGKLIRAQLTTQSGIECIDFAAAHNFQYILYDAGWYGAEFRDTSDPTNVIPAIDMAKVTQYGKGKGIGVILYVNYVGLKAKLDTLLPLYKKWGVAGFKFGFVDGLTQKGLTWLSQAIKKVNDSGFILDIHDNYKPTGLSRSYPALLTQEGIRGDENSPDAFHTTTLPFTRFLAGPADFTYCFPNAKNSFSKNIKVSKAQQLALTVVYFSPLQAIFWYGKPLDYTNEDEIEFYKYVPTVWNESRYLDGSIGKNISVARRKGDTWFVGNAAGLEDWKDNLKLDFLTKGKTYTATIWEDKGDKLNKKTMTVKRGNTLPFEIKAKGGQAMMIVEAPAASGSHR
jgi:alpha-glucosidase